MESKIFLAFGILTIICGITLLLQENFIIGAGGTVTGIWLAVENWKKVKNQKGP
ncbi:MAG: hypothetical protein AAF960_02865 [Bacteroidota bacterium]